MCYLLDRIMEFKQRVNKTNIKLGFLRLDKKNQKYFPVIEKSVKIIGIFENENEPVELTYSSKYGDIYGLTGWFKENKSIPGDYVKFKILEEEKKFKFSLEKGTGQRPYKDHTKSYKAGKDISVVGEPINFRGIVYGPLNEQGVVFLFSKIHDDLGIKIEAVQQAFPDAKARRFNGKGWVEEKIEFEYKSSDFLTHGHDVNKCDIIVCWLHDWKECPLEAIELKSLIKELPND